MALFRPKEVTEARAVIEAEYGPVVAQFEITHTPQGGAPETIRQGWLGVVLPLRQELLEEHGGVQTYIDVLTGRVRDNHDAVPVCGIDAVFALDDQNKENEAAFWCDAGLAYGIFVFRAHEGRIKPFIVVEQPNEG